MAPPSNQLPAPLNVHVLVDLERSANAGGHVKCWERFAAAAKGVAGLELHVHFSGRSARPEKLAPNVTLHQHAPVFSTRKLPFLGHVPDHTDLAKYHRPLARSVRRADVLHTTDGFFAFARTAESLSRRRKIPLVTSVHTDSVKYSELFARSMLEKGFKPFAHLMVDVFKVPERQGQRMARRLAQHMEACQMVLTSRAEDAALAVETVGAEHQQHLRLGLDRAQFNPARASRAALDAQHNIPPNATLFVFVGRLDEGKNIYVLIDALAARIAAGENLFLLAAGIGPAAETIREKLGARGAALGFLNADQLAQLYASANFLALPSQVETWSMAAAEALACGLPVIADARSGIGRFLAKDGGGILVAEDGVAAWEGALAKAVKQTGHAALRHAAASAAAQFPSWEAALLEDLLPVWRRAAGRG